MILLVGLPDDDWNTLIAAFGDHCDELQADPLYRNQEYSRNAQRVRDALVGAVVEASSAQRFPEVTR